MKTVLRKFALVALSASALTAMSNASQAVEFSISGGTVPLFAYGTTSPENNVVNTSGNATNSGIVDTSNTAFWLGSTAASPNSTLSVAGLSPGDTYTIQWTYVGSESGHNIQFTAPTTQFTENDINNNCLLCNHNGNPGPVVEGTSSYTGSIPTF